MVNLTLEQPRLLTIRQLCSTYPWPSESAMRAYVFRADELGLEDAFVRVGRRVLIKPDTFFTLIKQLESRSPKGGDKYETTKNKRGARS